MRTSLNEIRLIEDHLFNRETTGDSLLFSAMLILDTDLPEKMIRQKRTYAAVREYGRKKLKAEIQAVHQELFTAPKYRGFAQKILDIFS